MLRPLDLPSKAASIPPSFRVTCQSAAEVTNESPRSSHRPIARTGDHMAGTDNPPPETGRLTFESGGFRYEVFRPLLEHEDYDTLLLAWCGPLKEEDPRRLVVLK